MNEEEAYNTLLIGITGGIGSGKTTVAEIIKKRGYKVINTDDLAKNIMTKDKDAVKKIKSEFGEDVYNQDGSLNSEKLSERVFGESEAHKAALNKLNSIVHPKVIDKKIEMVEKMMQRCESLIFIESALIFEAGLEEGYDYIIVVYADEDIRINRTKQRTGMSEQEIRWRMEEQISLEKKRELADFVVENNGDLDDLDNSLDFVLGIVEDMVDDENY